MGLGTPTRVEQMMHFIDTSTPSTIFKFTQTNLVGQMSFHFCYHDSFHNFLGVGSCIKLNDKPIKVSRVPNLGGGGREQLEDATKLAAVKVSLLMLHHNWRKKTLTLKFDGNFNITIDNEHNKIRTQNLKTLLMVKLLCNVNVLTIMP